MRSIIDMFRNDWDDVASVDDLFDSPDPQQQSSATSTNSYLALIVDDDKGWLQVRKSSDNSIITISKYTRVKYHGYNRDKSREEFTILDWPHTNVRASVSAISSNQSRFKSIQFLEGGLIEFERDSYKLKFGNSSWIHAASDPSDLIPKGTHNLWLPDHVHTYGNPYLGDTAYATVWFRIGSESSDRYLHVGSVSAGCVTVGEKDTGGSQVDRRKWDSIYNYLIKRRSSNKFVGKIKVF